MNVFELMAKISLDTGEFDKKLKGVSGQLGTLTKPIGTAIKGITKGVTVMAGAAAAGVTLLTKSAVSAYAEYEQLVGGVETLFGTSADAVMAYADQAYKTAGLSANEYMETVTSFSASLLQSLGGDTAKAADYADMAIRDMSDNANKMGTSMEAIQSAYQGFAKQNYTMLDNLKLGYGGTKTEMERLVEDAERLNSSFKAQRDENGKLTLSYADIVDAIHIVQDNMGITGTTAREAASTISGSIASMKSAWKNLITGLSNPDADLGLLISNFVDSGKTALNNLIPAIRQTLYGISQIVTEAAPIIAAELPGLVTEILPALITATGTLVAAFIEHLPEILQAIGDALPGIMETIFQSIRSILPSSLIPAFDKLKQTIQGVIDYLKNLDEGQINTIKTIVEVIAMIAAVVAAVQGVISVIGTVSSVISFLASPAGVIVALITVGVLLYKNWDTIKETAQKVWQSVSESFTKLKERVAESIDRMREKMDALKQKFTDAWDKIKAIVDKLKAAFSFKWELPKIALPHLSISGRFSISPPSVPKFSISWYKKAYDTPFLFTKPTVVPGFGDGGGSGEMVYGRDRLLADIHQAAGNAENATMLASIYDRLVDILDRMERAVVLDDGTLVGKIAPKMDKGLNDVSDLMERGVSLA